jgi:hypothetical protein
VTYDSTVDDTLAYFLDFGVGVLSLVCLSASVIWGLVAQDRILLDARQRILAQAVHRMTAVASIVFLLVHIVTKLALNHTTWIAAVIPFGLVTSDEEGFAGRGFLIGLGTLASMLMIFVGVTGVLRNRFASPAPVAARWRAMHMLAYPAWCAALIHGLFAGREAKPVFVILYSLSLVAVGGALALRASPQPFKRKVARRIREMIGADGRPLPEEPPARRAMADARVPGSGSRRGFQEPFVPQQRTSSPSAASLYDTGQRSALTDTGSLYDTGQRPALTDTGSLYDTGQRSALTDTGSLYDTGSNPALTDTGGFAAAYRAVSNTPRAADPLQQQPEPTQRMQQLPLDMQPTETMPRVDGNTAGRWPTPSPPLYEAPPRPAENPTVYNPPYATYDETPAHGMPYQTPANPSYGSSDLYDTGETFDPLGTYNTNDTYDSGPATETRPGAYEAPSSGEPWNAPSGGF